MEQVVTLWLGIFKSREDFYNYVYVAYTETEIVLLHNLNRTSNLNTMTEILWKRIGLKIWKLI